jgi:hypothetical protein
MNLRGNFSSCDKTKTYVVPPRTGFHVFMDEFHEEHPTLRYLESGPTATFTLDYLPIIDALWKNLTASQVEVFEQKAEEDRKRCQQDCADVFPFARMEGGLEEGGGEGVEGGSDDEEDFVETGDMENIEDYAEELGQLDGGSEHGHSGVEDGASGEV